MNEDDKSAQPNILRAAAGQDRWIYPESSLGVCAADQPIRIGGLMRCCTQTLREFPRHGEPGDRIKCTYCDGTIAFGDDGAWRWGGSTGGGGK